VKTHNQSRNHSDYNLTSKKSDTVRDRLVCVCVLFIQQLSDERLSDPTKPQIEGTGAETKNRPNTRIAIHLDGTPVA